MLYFKFEKWLYFTLLVVSVLYLPIIVINYSGDGIADRSNLNALTLTTLGNLGTPENTTQVSMPGCEWWGELRYFLEDDDGECILKKEEVSEPNGSLETPSARDDLPSLKLGRHPLQQY